MARIALASSLLLLVGYCGGASFPLRPSAKISTVSSSDRNRSDKKESRSLVGQNATDRESDHEQEITFEEALARSASPVPDSFRRQMLMAGYFVDEAHRLTPVTLPTGEEIELPVRDVQVRYLGNAAFQ